MSCDRCSINVSCSVLHLLHHPWRAAGEPTGVGQVCTQRAGGHGAIGGQLLRAGPEGQAEAAGEAPSSGHPHKLHDDLYVGGMVPVKKVDCL